MDKEYAPAGFTARDDRKIVRLVKKYGRTWTKISREMDNRFMPHQIQSRYYNYLNPMNAKKDEWTDEDTARLVQLVDLHGRKWTWFADVFFQNRAPVFLQRRYIAFIKKTTEDAVERKIQDDKAKKEEEEDDDLKNSSDLFEEPPTDFDFNLNFFALD